MRVITPMIISLVLSITGFATTYYVPDDYGTLQGAIDASAHGDTIIARPGTYFENINFSGKAITLKSEQGSASTWIDGSRAGSVVTCNNTEGPDTVLEGFSIYNGKALYGGGMKNENASPTVCLCYFQANTADHGGGMHNTSSSPKMTQCKFLENMVAYEGGGMRNVNSSPTMTECTFQVNMAACGGGMANSTSSSPSVTECTFQENFAAFYGGGMFNYDSSPTVIECTFQENSANSYGGGVYNENSMSNFNQCTFQENSASERGGGVYNDGDRAMLNKKKSSSTMTQCTLLGNTAYIEGGGVFNVSGSPKVINCIVWGNTPNAIHNHNSTPDVTYSCIEGGYSGTGNIDDDPLFVDQTAGDIHLRYTSPCRDAGFNWAPGIPLEDFEGDPRITNGTVDMGVDEFHTHMYCTGDFSPNGSFEGKFVGAPGTWPVGLFIGSGIMDPPMQHKWGDFHLASPWILLPLIPIPADGVLVIPATLPATPAPYDIPMQTLIGSTLTNLCVLEVR